MTVSFCSKFKRSCREPISTTLNLSWIKKSDIFKITECDSLYSGTLFETWVSKTLATDFENFQFDCSDLILSPTKAFLLFLFFH